MSTNDKDYYRARALEERDRAATAHEPSIAAIHRDLADKYEALAKKRGVQPTLRSAWDAMPGAHLA